MSSRELDALRDLADAVSDEEVWLLGDPRAAEILMTLADLRATLSPDEAGDE